MVIVMIFNEYDRPRDQGSEEEVKMEARSEGGSKNRRWK